MKVQSQIEHTTLGHLVTSSEIFYDPDPAKTIVKEDTALVDLYNEVPEILDSRNSVSPWVLRLKLDSKRVISRAVDMDFISNKINDLF